MQEREAQIRADQQAAAAAAGPDKGNSLPLPPQGGAAAAPSKERLPPYMGQQPAYTQQYQPGEYVPAAAGVARAMPGGRPKLTALLREKSGHSIGGGGGRVSGGGRVQFQRLDDAAYDAGPRESRRPSNESGGRPSAERS